MRWTSPRVERHNKSIGLDVPNFEAKMRACVLEHLACNASIGALEVLSVVERRMQPVMGRTV